MPLISNYRAEYNYNIVLPDDYYTDNEADGRTCKILYSKDNEYSELNWLIDENLFGSGKNIQIISDNYSGVEAQANITATIKVEEYVWDKYCCAQSDGGCLKYCYNCKYDKTDYNTDSLIIQDVVNITNYIHNPSADFTITENYSNTFKGTLYKDNQTNVLLSFNNSYLTNAEFVYYANFSNKPYYFMYLIVEKQSTQNFRNLIYSNNSVYVSDASNCQIESTDFFTKTMTQCRINISSETNVPEKYEPVFNLNFLLKLAVFIFILFMIYKGIKKTWGKTLISAIVLLAFIPSVSAADDCGITNLASCIPQKIFEFFLSLLNAPLEPLLDLIKNLLQSAPSIALFQGVWAIIIYCISLFYGLLFVYAGFQFLFSGHDVMRREMAKEWLKNTVIMIVLIQASFYLYGLVLDLGSIMTTSILSMVDQHFFMITADNLVNIGLEFLFIFLYVIILLITLLCLTMRYLIVAFGVLFIPIGIFCYFIPPLRSYGRLIINILGMFIFITFLDAIIILACSMLITIPIFQNVKILVMITCFMIINILFFVLAKHIIHKTSMDNGADKLVQAGKYIAMMM